LRPTPTVQPPQTLAWGWRFWRWPGHLFHRALLRGLKAPRVAHACAPDQRPLRAATVAAHHLTTGHGKHLAVWLALPNLTGPATYPAVLVQHGWGANASMMWPVVQPLVDAGLAVLLLDARCHGNSSDEHFTSLPRFAEDMAAALAWLRQQPHIDGERVALLGHSVGAGACVLLAAQAGSNVRAVVSLSAFAHPAEMMQRWLAEHRLPKRLVGDAILHHVQQVIGARFDDIAPQHTIARVPCPVLLVHGHDDEAVPFGDAQRLLEAARSAGVHATLLELPGQHDLREALAPHVHQITGFLRQALGR
jgi:uncharacterized protein